MVKLLRRITNLFKKCKMAQINNLTSYPTATPPLSANSIVIGSIASGGATNNFLMSDIATYVMGANTLTLQDVCDNGTATTTGITVGGTTTLNGALDANSTADISGNTTIGGTLLVSGTSLLGDIDAGGVADIADTLTLSKATGTGLQVDANASIGGTLTMGIGDGVVTNQITAPSLANIAFYMGGVQRGAFVAPSGSFALQGGLQVQTGGTLINQGLTVNSLAQFNDDVLLDGTPPSSSTDTGTAGQIAVDAVYIYVCTATDTWGRVAIDTTPF
jgi:hypothetical protein